VKSAIMLAGVCAGVRTTVREPLLTRDHTERMLGALGVTVGRDGDATAVEPPASLGALDIDVPGDPSSAAFLVALGVLGGAPNGIVVERVLLNPLRLGFVATLRRMGANVTVEHMGEVANEPVGTIRVSASAFAPAHVEAADVPSMVDELPLLACVAARGEGESVIRGASELRFKESDRIRAVVDNLRALGVDAEELDDGMRVVGTKAPLRGAVRTEADHRIAMAFGILGALPGNEITIDDRECVDISYPGFWSDVAEAARW
jgi:3-phosphoshikimate 1-carboxyvinyltransferase